jgi:hypothetical protein
VDQVDARRRAVVGTGARDGPGSLKQRM